MVIEKNKKFKLKKNMKKFTSLSFMLVAALLIFTSCSKDDETPALDASLLEGTWNYTKSEMTMSSGEESESSSNDEAGTYEFKSDKTLVITEDGYSSEGTYSISGQTITITFDEEAQTYDVIELTANKLTFSYTFEMDFGIKITTVTTSYFTK